MHSMSIATKAPLCPDEPVAGNSCSALDDPALPPGLAVEVGATVDEGAAVVEGAAVAEATVVGVGRAVVVVVGRAGPDL